MEETSEAMMQYYFQSWRYPIVHWSVRNQTLRVQEILAVSEQEQNPVLHIFGVRIVQ